jgi:serine/threonine protein phosphatase PrpC
MPWHDAMAVDEMAGEITWRSEQGTHTKDNRDQCGVGLREDATLCIVLDGSTSGDNSGEFARQIAQNLIEWFVVAGEVTTEAIIDGVRVLHAGDCLAGVRVGSSPIDWRTIPHTLANATDEMSIEDLARSPLRNRITRSFRSREFVMPEVSDLALASDQTLVLATDGFWAALDYEQQAQFLAGEALPKQGACDDCSVLEVKVVDGNLVEIGSVTDDNLIFARAMVS